LYPLVDVSTVVTEWPAVEPAVAHRREEIRHEVAADFIALVDHRRERATRRFPGHAVRVAQARGKHPVRAGLRIDFPDCRAPGLCLDAVFASVAVRADRDIQ